MSLSICTEGQALVSEREREREREREEKNPFLFFAEGSVIMRACVTILSWLLALDAS